MNDKNFLDMESRFLDPDDTIVDSLPLLAYKAYKERKEKEEQEEKDEIQSNC